MNSLDRLSKRLKELQQTSKDDAQPILLFDKDDVDTLDFVTATSNLRASIFGIDSKSKFDTKREFDQLYGCCAMADVCQKWLEILSRQSRLQMP